MTVIGFTAGIFAVVSALSTMVNAWVGNVELADKSEVKMALWLIVAIICFK